jgi:hypothetical protein
LCELLIGFQERPIIIFFNVWLVVLIVCGCWEVVFEAVCTLLYVWLYELPFNWRKKLEEVGDRGARSRGNSQTSSGDDRSKDSHVQEEVEVLERSVDRGSRESALKDNREVPSNLEKEQILLQKMKQREQQIRQQNEELLNKKLLIEVRLLEKQEKEAEEGKNSGFGLKRAFLDVFENVTDQTVKLDEFRGPGDGPVATWIERIRSVADLKNWSEVQVYKRALLSIKPPARDAVQNSILTERNPSDVITDMKSLEKFLHQRYGVKNPVSHYLEIFQRIKQGPSENGKQFTERFQAIKNELDTACPKMFTPPMYLAWFTGGLSVRSTKLR